MLSEVAHCRNDEVHLRGYIRQNYLNANRLVHLTGLGKVGWKVKRIEFVKDPCPVKLSVKEKDQVMATSKAQSIVSSRKSSRRSSFDAEDLPVKQVVDPETKSKCAQFWNGKNADNSQIENNPGMFAAEQTWPTMEEMKQPPRKGSFNDEAMQDVDHEPMDFSNIIKKQPQKDLGEELAGLMQKLTIDVVGRETGKDSNDGMSDCADEEDDKDEDADEDAELGANDGEKPSGKHTKFTDLEERAKEDMDFPDEVDTPFTEAYKRF